MIALPLGSLRGMLTPCSLLAIQVFCALERWCNGQSTLILGGTWLELEEKAEATQNQSLARNFCFEPCSELLCF